MTPSKIYAVYDVDDFPIVVGTPKECAKRLGIKTESFRYLVYIRNKTHKQPVKKYSIYNVED